MTCAIIDDEPLAVKLIENYIQKTPDLELVGSYSSAVEAIGGLVRQHADILFLDIQMPEVDGLSFARMIQNTEMHIVFTTAFSEHAAESYRVSAADYLLKPVSYEDFLSAVSKVRKLSAQNSSNIESVATFDHNVNDSIFIKSDYKLIRLRYDDILYIEGLKDYVKIYVENEDRPILSLSAMRTVEQSMPAGFMRVHRSYIANMNKVKFLERGQLVFKDKMVPVSDSYKDQVTAYVHARMLQSK